MIRIRKVLCPVDFSPPAAAAVSYAASVAKYYGAKLHIVHVEVWHNEENAAWLDEVDKNPDGNVFCGGIPFFYNENTGKRLCGNQKYEKLKAWALGELK